MIEEAYELGKKAYADGKKREPLKDHTFENYIQTEASSAKHPKSPGAEMNSTQRRILEDKINSWKQGWDDARKEDS